MIRKNAFVHDQQEDSTSTPENGGDDSVYSGDEAYEVSAPSPKKRRGAQKKAISVPISEGDGSRSKTEVYPPPDSWSWRKYGQKPIKGSPYPRGYYRCSSSKGCPARKQVERSCLDPTKLLITYTCEHNHPLPNTTTKHHHHSPAPATAAAVSKAAAAAATASDNTNATASTSNCTSSSTGTDSNPVKFEEDGFGSFANQPDLDSDNSSGFSELAGEMGWFSDVGSTFVGSSTLVGPSWVDADVAVMLPIGEEDQSLFGDLGELPEYSVVFRRRGLESTSTATCCAGIERGVRRKEDEMAASSVSVVGNGLSIPSGFNKEFYGRKVFISSSLPSLARVPKVVLVRASQESLNEGRRGFLKVLLGNAGIGVPALLSSGKAYADDQGVSNSRMSYSRFLEYLDKDRVKRVDLYENGTIAIVEAISPELGNRVQRVRVQLPGLPQELLQKFREKNIDFAAHNAQEDSGSLLFNLIGNLAFPLILIGGLFLLSRRSSGGMGGPGGPGFPMAFGQSKAKFQMEPNTGVTFDDVAGVDEAKQDFMEVVEFLKKPERFTAVGARIPKGVLLVGPPGTGKTLLAKAIAGEAGVPFFSISGSEFVEMFVGVGASRVRDLFKKAKENAPCIVFVDEIDAVGRQRGTGIGGGNDEREQTLNQLLTEMDGFEGNTGIIVIAATNRADILDSALLRPGRFDRQVTVDVPDVRGRTEILKVHGGNKKFDSDVSLEVIAMRTPGFSGADLANLLNEAAILAGRRGKTAISSKEIDDSIDRIVAGMEGTVMTDGKSKSLVAYHEVGHAICGTLTPGHDAVQKVTLVPRGQARGLTWFIPADDPTLISKQQLFARIVGGLGGRAAEEVIFGEPEVTTGAAGDLQQITGLAKQMVVTFGMSDIGPWSLMDSSAQSGDVIMRMMARNSMSEKLAEDIDSAVKRISDSAYEIALSHIRNNREAIDKIVEVLLEKETLTGDEFRAILSEFVEIPVENRVPPAVKAPVAV
ncbi:OLC1v1023677C1 [Oldenlandia corymbosa var. corymbosa]|uniref:ATP-dependent zinc metalloprotease FTSH, chloroplastic n=1 Tax=Oldenlandia corymbosa var. corymbosa TaxID=529605 RepID=A0AAV1C1G3_OLDCO|nr:OLC1v1023677C1 [Oldenlandia corymbosa var. corymbosa]